MNHHTPHPHQNSTRQRIGVGLLIAGIVVGVAWLTTGNPGLEPLGFILVTTGGVLTIA